MLQIKLKSLNKESITFYKIFIGKIFNSLNISFNWIDLPNKKKRITLLKSPHVNKSAREQFQVTTYKTLILVRSKISLNQLKLVVLNKPKTVKIIIKK
jgi:small subunit ribosomal protein S10